jgi:PleD family two-component response regulator
MITEELSVLGMKLPVLVTAYGNSYSLGTVPRTPENRRKTSMPRVLIVDDHDVVRQGVRHILETQDDCYIVG